MKKLILISLNELNFDALKKYDLNKYPNLKFLSDNSVPTSSENDYHLLEPWIQWLTIYSGLSAKDHNIFRLGDINKKKICNVFNKLENFGFSVAAICPMNLSNNLQNPKFFIPDPWTRSNTDGSYVSNIIYKTLSKVINTNASNKIQILDLIKILIIFVNFFRIKNLIYYLQLLVKSFKYKYFKAIFLDMLLNDIFYKLNKIKKANFSNIFFNGAAHIQHHYFLNSKFNISNLKNPEWYIDSQKDPFEDMLKYYDIIISDYIKKNSSYIIATGLSQIPYDKKKYYYRINNYKNILDHFSISFKRILPRMSRDFLIEFYDNTDAMHAEKKLKKIYDKKNNIFLFREIENRGDSLFVTLTYPEEINKETIISDGHTELTDFYKNVNLVAMKNGMHNQKGYICTSNDIKIENNLNIKNIKNKIEEFFLNE